HRAALVVRVELDGAAAKVHRSQLGPALAVLDEERAARVVPHPVDLLAPRRHVDPVVERDEPHGHRHRPTVTAQRGEDPGRGEGEHVPRLVLGHADGHWWGSLGRPSTRSASTLRWIWSVPPPMPAAKLDSATSTSGPASMPSAPSSRRLRSRDERAMFDTASFPADAMPV